MGDLDGRKGSRNWFLLRSEWAPRGLILISARSPLFDQILLVIAYIHVWFTVDNDFSHGFHFLGRRIFLVPTIC